MPTESADCPCRAPDGTPIHDCPDCDGSGAVEVEALREEMLPPDDCDAGWVETAGVAA